MGMNTAMAMAMVKRENSLLNLMLASRSRIILFVGAGIGTCCIASNTEQASAQSRTTRETATAYGARLNAKGEIQNLNPARINSRVSSRVSSRIQLRLERFIPGSSSDPASAYRVTVDDGSRRPLVLAKPDLIDEDNP